MFILPPNCIVPSATSLTMRPVFPSFLNFISHTPCGRSGRHQVDIVRVSPSEMRLARDVVSDPRLTQSERPKSFLRCPIGVGHSLVLTDVLEPGIQQKVFQVPRLVCRVPKHAPGIGAVTL